MKHPSLFTAKRHSTYQVVYLTSHSTLGNLGPF
jgi:hypothetical protein